MSYHQTIYNLLIGYGLSKNGAMALLGNWECESNCEPYRLQGDFSPSRALSHEYVEKIENRQMSRDQFAGDSKGFGLAQWTYPTRKAALYDLWLTSPFRIDSCDLQVEFAMHELQNEYQGLLNTLKQDCDLYNAVSRVCREYERPAVNNIDARYQSALNIEREFAKNEEHQIPTNNSGGYGTTPTAPGWATMPVWAPGVLEYGAKGVEVRLLQDLLCCHDYYCTPDGIFGKDTEKKLKAFQRDAGLDPDGSCGPQTWKALGVDVWDN